MKLIYKTFLSVLLASFLITGCDTEALHDLNINPNAVNQIDLNYFLTAAELGVTGSGNSGTAYTDQRTNIGMCAHAIQQLAFAGGNGVGDCGDKYVDNDDQVSTAPFDYWITDVGKTTAEIIRQAGPGGYAEGKKINTLQAARILRVLTFHRLTDFYGSIPYSEANRGVDGIFFPKYDKQKDIYTDLLKELDEATAAISTSNADDGFAAADIVYYGDIAKWKKFGYSLMLRLAMRISNVAPEMSNTYITKAIAGGVFTSNDDNMWVQMADGPSEWWNQNSISRSFYVGDREQESLLSKTFIDWLKGDNKNDVSDDDPRLMICSGGLADWTPQAWTPIDVNPLDQKGMPNGYDQSMLDILEGHAVDQWHEYSRVNFLMLQRSEPYMLMNVAEVEFLQAEALERGLGSGITGTAKAHYEKGVKDAMQMYTLYDASLTVSDAQVANYLSIYPYGVKKPALEMIGEQMWASHFLNWYEAWSDWRRTGYPALTPVNYKGNDTNGTIPVRLRYPNSEISGNPNFASTSTKPDLITTKVWWDGGEE